MKVNITNNDHSAPRIAALGVIAWERDSQKVSMHPPLPEDIEHVQHDMDLHAHQHNHRNVHRRDPEHDRDGGVVRMELMQKLPFKYIKPLLEGKGYIWIPIKRHHAHSSSSRGVEIDAGERQVGLIYSEETTEIQ